MGTHAALRIDAAGDFDIRGLAPGANYAAAPVYASNATHQAKAPVGVGASNVPGIELAVGLGITIRGWARAEAGVMSALELRGVRTSLQPREASGVLFGRDPAQPNGDGMFKISNVQRDACRWKVTGCRRAHL